MVVQLAKLAIVLLFATAVSCADNNFIEKSKKDGSVLMGYSVGDSEALREQVVMIAKNFESVQLDNQEQLKVSYFGICSAVVIHEQYLLTAAHCVDSFEKSRVLFKYNVSQSSVDQSQIYRIAKVYKHKKYDQLLSVAARDPLSVNVNSEINYYDIAVLKLERPLLLTVKPVDLVEVKSSQIHTQIQATVAGYGRNTDMLNVLYDEDANVEGLKKSFTNGYLQKAHLSIDGSQENNRIIVLDQRDKAGVCKGDSGGALFVSTVGGLHLKAIAINVLKDKVNDPVNLRNECYGHSYFLNIDYYKKWILSIIGE